MVEYDTAEYNLLTTKLNANGNNKRPYRVNTLFRINFIVLSDEFRLTEDDWFMEFALGDDIILHRRRHTSGGKRT
jgi:hypothetical protein